MQELVLFYKNLEFFLKKYLRIKKTHDNICEHLPKRQV